MIATPGALSAQESGPIEFGGNYNYVHSNAPPGGCGCFSLQGGSFWGAYGFTRNFSLIGEIAVQRSADVGISTQSLTITSYSAGPRYAWPVHGRFRLFAQTLVGGVHASGSFAPGGSGGFPGSPNSVTFLAGGGLDAGLNRHLSLRAFQADYYLTHFANGVNNHQNNLRIGVGLSFRF